MFSLVSAGISGLLASARETVDFETPASFAKSTIWIHGDISTSVFSIKFPNCSSCLLRRGKLCNSCIAYPFFELLSKLGRAHLDRAKSFKENSLPAAKVDDYPALAQTTLLHC